MKPNQLKELLKHIILEVNSQFEEGTDYDNFDDPSNVANAIYSGLYKAPENAGVDKDGGQQWSFTLHSNSGPRHMIKRDKDGEWFFLSNGVWKYAGNYIAAKKKDREEYKRTGKLANEMIANKNVPPDVFGAVNVEEETGTSAVAGYSTPFAFKRKKKKKKHVKEIENAILEAFRKGKIKNYNELENWVERANGVIKQHNKKSLKENRFISKVKEKLASSSLTSEKTLPDGRYVDDMEDGRKSKRVAGMNEMTTSSAAGGQPGGTIQVPAWGTKNKLGSPKAIAATTKQLKGYKVVKSITNE